MNDDKFMRWFNRWIGHLAAHHVFYKKNFTGTLRLDIGVKFSKNYEKFEIWAWKPSEWKIRPREEFEACIWSRGRVRIWENVDQN